MSIYLRLSFNNFPDSIEKKGKNSEWGRIKGEGEEKEEKKKKKKNELEEEEEKETKRK